MTHWLLTLELIDNPLLVLGTRALSLALAFGVVAVPLRRRPRRWWRFPVAAVAGAVIVCALAFALQSVDLFDGPLPGLAYVWLAWAGAGIGLGVAGLMSGPWGRRALGGALIVVAVLIGGLGVNRAYDITHTLAAILGVQTIDSAPLPPRDGAADDPAPLYSTWQPPADMPAAGRVSALSGDERIPRTDFAARDGALYLPPAALVADPPPLPVLVFMMGEPGSPDPTALARALDAFAASHRGLAPIALVVDQLGAVGNDPACANSAAFGRVSDYINQAVPAYIDAHLNVDSDRAHWVIGGFSNGGSCAWSYIASHPDVWGNLLNVSGNEYPGSEHVDQTVRDIFAGDRAAFDASIPTAVIARSPGAFEGHTAVFTRGSEDTVFGPGQVRNAAAARKAGFTVVEGVVDGAGHTGAALDGGLQQGLAALAPTLGLAPASAE